jgi:hypothetical protein
MRPNFVVFFFTMNQFDWPITQKNEPDQMKLPLNPCIWSEKAWVTFHVLPPKVASTVAAPPPPPPLPLTSSRGF